MKKSRIAISMQIFLFLLFISLIGCADKFLPSDYQDNNQQSEGETENPPVNELPDDLLICSKIDFNKIKWPITFNVGNRNSFALALNVTGSFEGSHTWTTLAGDSDKQGISLGLLQQNLGSGTLQPLLAAMKKYYSIKMKSYFSSSHWTSISAMIDGWVQSHPVNISPLQIQPLFSPDDVVVSPLDENYESNNEFFMFADSAVSKTLTWARQNILSGVNVKSDWKKELQGLADSTEYRNFQFIEALDLHNKTEAYRHYFKFNTLTAYLFLYDVVVQNGSFNETHKSLYQNWVKLNSASTEIQRLKKLLEIRLTTVKSQYRADVNARKTTIINGIGTVHGSQRNLAKEYCYQGAIQIDPL